MTTAHVNTRELQTVRHLFVLDAPEAAMTAETKHALVVEMITYIARFAERENLAIVDKRAAVRQHGKGWRVVGILEGVYAHREAERTELEADLRFLISR